MTALQEALAQVLAEHGMRWSDDGGWADCSCGHTSAQSLAPDELGDAHRAHVAAVQAEVVAGLRYPPVTLNPDGTVSPGEEEQ